MGSSPCRCLIRPLVTASYRAFCPLLPVDAAAEAHGRSGRIAHSNDDGGLISDAACLRDDLRPLPEALDVRLRTACSRSLPFADWSCRYASVACRLRRCRRDRDRVFPPAKRRHRQRLQRPVSGDDYVDLFVGRHGWHGDRSDSDHFNCCQLRHRAKLLCDGLRNSHVGPALALLPPTGRASRIGRSPAP